ncbi:unnamed protein product [Didymodactylos carnosus]|uniref:Uncharacterized protein n=1 Tax=Didymodactylos carnosus TaxID=1234261 RepID=A0A814C7I2_9BILA|nr:unnamed protein product [Didymodactylos carnosus]CAF3713588.1 unnamed protein product [Didymodactylos carnosus]
MVNDKYRLLTGQGFDAQWQSAVNNNDDVFVISMIGNSRVGKSLIVKAFSLENENSPTAAPPEVDDLLVRTTGNIGCYESRNMSEGTSKTLVLDYEGEDSGLPLMLRLRRHMHGSYKENERRKFVKESFPKLAYILSNIDNIDLLKTRINEIYHQHVQQQRLITHMQWLFMTDSVLETVSDGGTVSLVILLTQLTDTGYDYESIAKKLFIHLYTRNDTPSQVWYAHCRTFTMKLLARSIAMKTLEQKERLEMLYGLIVKKS